jgi:hypothetical protein
MQTKLACCCAWAAWLGGLLERPAHAGPTGLLRPAWRWAGSTPACSALARRPSSLSPGALALACWLELAARERHALQAAAAAAAPAGAGCPRPLATRRCASASPHAVLQVRAPQSQKSPAHKQKKKEGEGKNEIRNFK